MSDANRELRLEEIPQPPLHKLVAEDGADIFEETEVGGEEAKVGALFSSRELAEEFSGEAETFEMGSLSNLEPKELEDWRAVERYASSGADYVLVVTERGTGLFYASDISAHISEATDEFSFPLHFFTDEAGESPLISVEQGGETLLVVALFTSVDRAESFRAGASRLDLPKTLGTIWDRDGLRRHALVAKNAGADYAVFDPESGLTEAITLDELVEGSL
ncbi:MAG: hypothetical protein ACRDSJ_24875 [Rubrobacteraceae bacterium]